MANATYDGIWRDAMGELSEQLHVEGVDDLGGDVPTSSKNNVRETTVRLHDENPNRTCIYFVMKNSAVALDYTCFESMHVY